MKKKTIIQVCGAGGTGKTSTIKIVREEIEKRYFNSKHTYNRLSIAKGDINEILEILGKKVCIESMGDDLLKGGLKSRLNNYIKKEKCDLLICAGRKYNNVVSHISKLSETYDYRLVIATNYKLNKKKETLDTLYDYNVKTAKEIVDLIEDLIASRI